MSQGPTLINLPPSGSDTPSEMPGTPTSTTTSLSALSTTAVKDGHRNHHLHTGPFGRSHAHTPSTTSLEAERADRISRLAGLERISALRAIPHSQHAHQNSTSSSYNPVSVSSAAASVSPQVAPTSSTGFPLNYPPNAALTPAYFDSHGQPTAGPTKMSTVGTASATTQSTHHDDSDDARTTTEDQDEDMMSATDTASMGPMMAGDALMDEYGDGIGSRSVAGFEDRMSDDGSASLVGFGEGAGSTVSGPIYQRRPLPQLAAQGSNASSTAPGTWHLERQGSGFSDVVPGLRRDKDMFAGSDTPISASALQERREARMMDGVAQDSAGVPLDEMFIDTTTRNPMSNAQLQQQHVYGNMNPSSFGQTIRAHPQQPRTPLHQQTMLPQPGPSSASREAERIIESFDRVDSRLGANPSLGSPGLPGERLGRFYFEDGRK